MHGAWCMIANVFTLNFENASMDYAGHKFYKNFALFYLVFIVIFGTKHWHFSCAYNWDWEKLKINQNRIVKVFQPSGHVTKIYPLPSAGPNVIRLLLKFPRSTSWGHFSSTQKLRLSDIENKSKVKVIQPEGRMKENIKNAKKHSLGNNTHCCDKIWQWFIDKIRDVQNISN